jgi:hypothetical protein
MALLKLLLFLILLYYIIRTARNLVRAALRNGAPPAPRMAPPHPGARYTPYRDVSPPPAAPPSPPWKRPSRRRTPDVEDARWEDV